MNRNLMSLAIFGLLVSSEPLQASFASAAAEFARRNWVPLGAAGLVIANHKAKSYLDAGKNTTKDHADYKKNLEILAPMIALSLSFGIHEKKFSNAPINKSFRGLYNLRSIKEDKIAAFLQHSGTLIGSATAAYSLLTHFKGGTGSDFNASGSSFGGGCSHGCCHGH